MNHKIGSNNIDTYLRPATWSEFIGQDKVKKKLDLIIRAAISRNEVCDHLLFYGQSGLGKTTLAHLVASRMNAPIKTVTGPALEKPGDLAAILTNLEAGDILFIDEVHRLNKQAEELLYPAMEKRKFYVTIGKGPSARLLGFDLPPFTLISATTKINLLSSPFRSRFGGIFRLSFYPLRDIEKIIERSAKLLNVKIKPEAIKILARASRYTPRIANRLLKRARDYTEVYHLKVITRSVAEKTLNLLEIDKFGLGPADRNLIRVIINKFNGGPVGVKILAAVLGEDFSTIEDFYEPFLIKQGFLVRTPRGRMVTKKAYQYYSR